MLKLYQAEDCPYSRKVRVALTELGVSYVVHNPRTATKDDTRNPQTRAELVAIGGKDRLPFVVDHVRGRTLHESDDVIDHVERYYGTVDA